jgi:hypothetical protein
MLHVSRELNITVSETSSGRLVKMDIRKQYPALVIQDSDVRLQFTFSCGSELLNRATSACLFSVQQN